MTIQIEHPWYIDPLKSEKVAFEEWASTHMDTIHQTLTEVMPESNMDLKAGDMVRMLNGNGVLIVGLTIMGFDEPDKYGNCIYLDWDCYWCPVSTDRILDVLRFVDVKADTLKNGEVFIYNGIFGHKVDNLPWHERSNLVHCERMHEPERFTLPFDAGVKRLL